MVLSRVLYTIIECSIKQEENSMSKLLKYLKKYEIESILAPFFKLIEVAFELTVPLIVSTIIDVGIENGDKVYIIITLLQSQANLFSESPLPGIPHLPCRRRVGTVISHSHFHCVNGRTKIQGNYWSFLYN